MTGSGRTQSDGYPAIVELEVYLPRILAIDYGRKRIGLALSDELGLTAQPLATLVRKNRRDDLRRLREIRRQHEVGKIVVGYPLHMTGEAGEMAEEAKRFAARLEKDLRVEVVLVDERLTSWEAQELMGAASSKSRRKNKYHDDVAAAVLLRDYLNQERGESLDSSANKE